MRFSFLSSSFLQTLKETKPTPVCSSRETQRSNWLPFLTTKETKPPLKRGVGGIVTAIATFICIIYLSSIAVAQQPPAADIRDAWKPVYKQLPNLPLENKYISRESGKVNPDNTLVNRSIEYHVYVKGRAPNYRLDWKLTLADYLGANELIQDTTYPGAKTLRQNPLEGDRAAINRLNRQQRDALVQALVNVFTPNTSTSPSNESPNDNQQPATNNQQPTFSQPKPGDADLLK